jgi:hypothetical protein
MRKKSKVEKHIDVVNSVIKLEEMILSHIVSDELVGDCVLIDANKIKVFIDDMKRRLTDNFSVELKRVDRSGVYEPLKNAINTMNNERGRKRSVDEPPSEDLPRETTMGEESKFSPFGGVKIDKD